MSFFDDQARAEGHPFSDSDLPRRRRFSVRLFLGYLLTFLFFVGAGYAFTAQAPYVIEQPGTMFDVLGKDAGAEVIQVQGAKTYPTSGNLYLLTVQLVGIPGHTPSWFEVWQAWNDPKKKVLPFEAIYPPGQSSDAASAQEVAMMQDSQQQASAAALRELGYTIGDKVNVYSVDKGSPAEGVLKPNDIVVGVNGKKLLNGDTLRALVSANKGKSALRLEILRSGETKFVEVTPKLIGKNYRMGISITDSYDFPFKIDLKLQNVGGPSGGMIFALGIIDELTPGSLTGGQSIAGTGEIDGNGVVYPIGGIQQKMWSAVDGGATWFLAPEANCDEVVGHIPAGLKVTKVANLKEALAAVKAIAADPKHAALPECTASK